jgi:2-polyprenyl-3-methyl-5-hydroxy-6-metoxy-1,4-benzoquinol methylase
MQKLRNMAHVFIRAAAKRFIPLLVTLPPEYLRSIIFQLIRRKINRMPPDEALRFLFNLDNDLYPHQSDMASRYNGGVHAKHRLTNYHDFFVNRIKAGERVLDVGSSSGAVAYDIAERSEANVVGIDIDVDSIERGKDQFAHPRLELLAGDVYTWKTERDFDVVVLSNVLEHLKERPGLLKRLQELSKAGRFLIRVPVYERDWRVALKRELGMEWRLDNTHETEYTVESFGEEMEAAGLNISHLEVRWGEIWSELRANGA